MENGFFSSCGLRYYQMIINFVFIRLTVKSHLRNQKRKRFQRTAFSFLERCVLWAERDAHFVRDVSLGSAVRFAREKEHITSLCAIGAIHHFATALHHLPARANITLYKRLILSYNYFIKAKGCFTPWDCSVQLKRYYRN